MLEQKIDRMCKLSELQQGSIERLNRAADLQMEQQKKVTPQQTENHLLSEMSEEVKSESESKIGNECWNRKSIG